MVAFKKNKMAAPDREYSPFYHTFFSVMIEDRPSILFVSCTMTYKEYNDSEIIMKIDFQIIIFYI